jgi:hypothetical protein
VGIHARKMGENGREMGELEQFWCEVEKNLKKIFAKFFEKY